MWHVIQEKGEGEALVSPGHGMPFARFSLLWLGVNGIWSAIESRLRRAVLDWHSLVNPSLNVHGSGGPLNARVVRRWQ